MNNINFEELEKVLPILERIPFGLYLFYIIVIGVLIYSGAMVLEILGDMIESYWIKLSRKDAKKIREIILDYTKDKTQYESIEEYEQIADIFKKLRKIENQNTAFDKHRKKEDK